MAFVKHSTVLENTDGEWAWPQEQGTPPGLRWVSAGGPAALWARGPWGSADLPWSVHGAGFCFCGKTGFRFSKQFANLCTNARLPSLPGIFLLSEEPPLYLWARCYVLTQCIVVIFFKF